MTGVIDVEPSAGQATAKAADTGTFDVLHSFTETTTPAGMLEAPAIRRAAQQATGPALGPAAVTKSRHSIATPSIKRVRGHAWVGPYLRRLVATDAVAALLAGILALVVRLPGEVDTTRMSVTLVRATVLLPLMWVAVLGVCDAYDKRILGLGPDEYQRTGRAFLVVMALVGFTSYALRIGIDRRFVVIALPAAAVLSLGSRWVLRKHLHRARSQGRVRTSVIAVGDVDSVTDLASRMHREAYTGLRVIGACLPREQLTDEAALARLGSAGIVALGDLDGVGEAVARSQVDTVAVASSPAISPRRLRTLSWELERLDADLVVAPGLMEVAGPRLHIRPVTGLPLLQIEKPEFTGGRRLVKGFVDRSAALVGLLLLSPLFVALWFAVRLGSDGGAFFTQTRVGKDGDEFRIWKFRSMYTGAEQRKSDYLADNDNDGLLFKMRSDPRVTPIGRVIRRLSLDELPQLFNVLNGTMSLVGPRPPLPEEVQQYANDMHRRLLVRPGVTGLWQVSGRSDLSWEESVRLDLRYVENWSLGWDVQILWKTASAVLHGSGAY